MKNLPKVGLPVILLVFVNYFISKSSINIGYGEAGVLFKTWRGVVTDEQTHEGFV